MKHEQREIEVGRLQSWLEFDDDGPISDGGLYVVMKNFPPPNAHGTMPEQRTVTVAGWIRDLEAFRREANASGLSRPRIEQTISPPPAPVPAA